MNTIIKLLCFLDPILVLIGLILVIMAYSKTSSSATTSERTSARQLLFVGIITLSGALLATGLCWWECS